MNFRVIFVFCGPKNIKIVYSVNRNIQSSKICCLVLLGAHHFLHVSRIRLKLLTFRQLMSYIYMEHPFLIFLDHTRRRSTVGRTPLDEWSAHRRDLRSQQVSGRRPLACWDLGFESHGGHRYLSVVSVVCCQVEVSAMSWSLIQRSPTDCVASSCVI